MVLDTSNNIISQTSSNTTADSQTLVARNVKRSRVTPASISHDTRLNAAYDNLSDPNLLSPNAAREHIASEARENKKIEVFTKLKRISFQGADTTLLQEYADAGKKAEIKKQQLISIAYKEADIRAAAVRVQLKGKTNDPFEISAYIFQDFDKNYHDVLDKLPQNKNNPMRNYHQLEPTEVMGAFEDTKVKELARLGHIDISHRPNVTSVELMRQMPMDVVKKAHDNAARIITSQMQKIYQAEIADLIKQRKIEAQQAADSVDEENSVQALTKFSSSLNTGLASAKAEANKQGNAEHDRNISRLNGLATDLVNTNVIVALVVNGQGKGGKEPNGNCLFSFGKAMELLHYPPFPYSYAKDAALLFDSQEGRNFFKPVKVDLEKPGKGTILNSSHGYTPATRDIGHIGVSVNDVGNPADSSINNYFSKLEARGTRDRFGKYVFDKLPDGAKIIGEIPIRNDNHEISEEFKSYMRRALPLLDNQINGLANKGDPESLSKVIMYINARDWIHKTSPEVYNSYYARHSGHSGLTHSRP